MTTIELSGGFELPERTAGGIAAADPGALVAGLTPSRPLNASRYLPHGRRTPRFRDRWPILRLLIAAAAIVGVGVMEYPVAAAWFSDQEHAGVVSGYVTTVGSIDPADRTRLLDAAHKYNETLPSGTIRDPYTVDGAGQETEVGDGVAKYRDTLNVGTAGMMGVVDIPEVGVDLPIYHGTSDSTLAKGVGHLYGTSLPVGGPGTHAVLTGHSGFVDATLFNNISKLKLGDTFSVNVLGDVLTYQVDQILTVLPEDTDALQRVAGKDYVTLITCTPIGINTHRLLVRGHRIPTPPTVDQESIRGGTGGGFPWWVVAMLGTIVLSVVMTIPLRRRMRGGPRHSAEVW